MNFGDEACDFSLRLHVVPGFKDIEIRYCGWLTIIVREHQMTAGNGPKHLVAQATAAVGEQRPTEGQAQVVQILLQVGGKDHVVGTPGDLGGVRDWRIELGSSETVKISPILLVVSIR